MERGGPPCGHRSGNGARGGQKSTARLFRPKLCRFPWSAELTQSMISQGEVVEIPVCTVGEDGEITGFSFVDGRTVRNWQVYEHQVKRRVRDGLLSLL